MGEWVAAADGGCCFFVGEYAEGIVILPCDADMSVRAAFGVAADAPADALITAWLAQLGIVGVAVPAHGTAEPIG